MTVFPLHTAKLLFHWKSNWNVIHFIWFAWLQLRWTQYYWSVCSCFDTYTIRLWLLLLLLLAFSPTVGWLLSLYTRRIHTNFLSARTSIEHWRLTIAHYSVYCIPCIAFVSTIPTHKPTHVNVCLTVTFRLIFFLCCFFESKYKWKFVQLLQRYRVELIRFQCILFINFYFCL